MPQWLRDALNKKEKEKQKKFEKENAKKASSDETDEEEAISTDRLNRKQSPIRKVGLLILLFSLLSQYMLPASCTVFNALISVLRYTIDLLYWVCVFPIV